MYVVDLTPYSENSRGLASNPTRVVRALAIIAKTTDTISRGSNYGLVTTGRMFDVDMTEPTGS